MRKKFSVKTRIISERPERAANIHMKQAKKTLGMRKLKLVSGKRY